MGIEQEKYVITNSEDEHGKARRESDIRFTDHPLVDHLVLAYDQSYKLVEVYFESNRASRQELEQKLEGINFKSYGNRIFLSDPKDLEPALNKLELSGITKRRIMQRAKNLSSSMSP